MGHQPTYTQRDLQRIAVQAIKKEAQGVQCKARTLGFSVQITEHEHVRLVRLVAHGQRTDNGLEFDVSIGI